MSSRAEHYRRAEELLAQVESASVSWMATKLAAQAQVHAILATVDERVYAEVADIE